MKFIPLNAVECQILERIGISNLWNALVIIILQVTKPGYPRRPTVAVMSDPQEKAVVE